MKGIDPDYVPSWGPTGKMPSPERMEAARQHIKEKVDERKHR